jgi:hypothetical protein
LSTGRTAQAAVFSIGLSFPSQSNTAATNLRRDEDMDHRAKIASDMSLVKKAIAYHAEQVDAAAATGDVEGQRLHGNILRALNDQLLGWPSNVYYFGKLAKR